MFYQIKRTALLEFIPLIDVSISIGTVEHKADIKDEKLLFTFTFMHLADAFIQSDLQCIQVIHLLSVCVPWELNPQPLRCKCSSLPLSHRNTDPFHTITAVSLWHIDITRLLVSSFEILSPAFNAANSNCCLFWGVSAFTLLFSRWNSCSIRFKSGDWLGQSKTFHFFNLINTLTELAGCFGSLS